MNTQHKKMVVTDLDGTLLRNDKTISDYSLHIINQFRKRGNLFVIATARPVRAVKNFMVRCDFDAGIYHNGALICDKDSKIGGFGIKDPYDVSRKILSVFPDVCLAVESDDVLYANFDAERLWPGNGFVYSDSFTELKGKTGCTKGIAVENALEPVKDIVSEICESNEDDGVAKWIKENLLLNKNKHIFKNAKSYCKICYIAAVSK